MTSARWSRPAAALVVLLSAVACGGGGGGGNNSPPPDPTPTARTIGGTTSGLSGGALVLQNNGGDNLAVSGNGPFTFATSIPQGNAYNVTVLTQPSNPKQTCVVSNGSGAAGSGNVTSIAVACTTDTFTVSATVSGLTGTGLVIANGPDRITANTNGPFTFDTAVASGARYNVLVDAAPTDPVQRCTVTNGNGAVGNADVTVAIACAATFPTLAYNLNQGDGTLASYAIDAASGQMRPRFIAKTGAGPVQLATYKPANGKRFAYVANQDGDTVSAFALDPRTGAMTEVPGSPFASGGDRPTQLTLHPSRPFLYAINENSASIAAYTVDADSGVLSQVGPATTGSTPRAFSIEASGRFAYVATAGSGELFAYAIDQTTGALSQVPNGRAAIGTSFGGMTLERNGRFAYTFDSAAGTISAFAINAATGAPTQIPGGPLAAGANIALLSVHPNGKFIYARRGPPTQDTANGVAVFAINDTTGALSEIAGSPFDVSANPLALAFDPTGRSMYAGHLLVQGTPEFNVRAYWVNPDTGALTTIAGSPFASPAFPSSLDVDSSGKYLYVANTQSNQLTAYGIDNGDGSLSQLASSPLNVGATPVVVATEDDTTALRLSSKFVYATDPAGSIRSYTIGADGMLAAAAVPSVPASAPLGITLDPRGRFAYVADPGANAVRIYAVDPGSGSLAAIASNPAVIIPGGDPQYVAIESSGRYAYVSVPSTTSILKYTVDATTGALSSPVSKAVTDDVQDLAITPNGRWLMATSADGSAVRTYSIDPSSGDLGSEVSLDFGPTIAIASIAVDQSGKFAYITDLDTANGEGELRKFQINAQTGALSPVGLPFVFYGIGVPKGLAVDPKGGFVFTADSIGNSVSMFSLNAATGDLTYRGSNSTAPTATNPVAVTTDYSGEFVRVATANGELLTFRVNRSARNLTLVDTETGGGAISQPATIVTSSHAE